MSDFGVPVLKGKDIIFRACFQGMRILSDTAGHFLPDSASERQKKSEKSLVASTAFAGKEK